MTKKSNQHNDYATNIIKLSSVSHQNKVVTKDIVSMLRSREKSLFSKKHQRAPASWPILHIIRNLCDTTFSGNIELGIR